jgi:CRP-like cAMP-binding protein
VKPPLDRPALLQSVSIFSELKPDELQHVAAIAIEKHFNSGEYLMRQDDPAEYLFVVSTGHIKLTQLSPAGDQILLRHVTSGGMFGGIAVIGNVGYPISAEALSDCHVLLLPGDAVRQLMSEIPHLASGIIQHLVERVQNLQQQLQELSAERVEQRVARALVRLASQVGQRTEEGILINIALSRKDLAEMTGTTLYTVSRILSGWEKRALIDAGRERVVIKKPHGIVAIAEDLPAPRGK